MTTPAALARPKRQGVIRLTPSHSTWIARRVSAPAPTTFSASWRSMLVPLRSRT